VLRQQEKVYRLEKEIARKSYEISRGIGREEGGG
jgi:hypothetical protein